MSYRLQNPILVMLGKSELFFRATLTELSKDKASLVHCFIDLLFNVGVCVIRRFTFFQNKVVFYSSSDS